MAGTFARLPGHNLNIPMVHPTAVPERPVIPTAAFAAQLSKQLSEIMESYSPLKRAEEAAKIAQYKYMENLYAHGDPRKNSLLEYQKMLINARIAHENAMTARYNPKDAMGDHTLPFRAYAQHAKALSDKPVGYGPSATTIERDTPQPWTPPANPMEITNPMEQMQIISPPRQQRMMPPGSFNPQPDSGQNLSPNVDDMGELTDQVFV